MKDFGLSIRASGDFNRSNKELISAWEGGYQTVYLRWAKRCGIPFILGVLASGAIVPNGLPFVCGLGDFNF
jgi:hypothetical protein